METRQVEIDELRLCVLAANRNDAGWYEQRRVYEEKRSPLYPLLQAHGFSTFVDVGANYGLISLLARRSAPSTRVVSIEADPRVAALISANFELNGIEPPTIVNAIVGDETLNEVEFSLNPTSSLDNRVAMPGWERRTVPMRTLDDILDELGVDGPTFYKIDTQGYELHVLRGAERSLSRGQWILKMEFAPDWLRSQGTDPLELLRYLVDRYEVAEAPARLAYKTRSFAALFDAPLVAAELAAFLHYVTGLDRNGRGWVDLVVRPR